MGHLQGTASSAVTLEQVRSRLPGAEANVLLSPYTTFRLGGPGEFFVRAETPDAVVGAVNAARELGLSLTPLGGGSNVVIADPGIRGLVVLLAIAGVEHDGDRLTVGSGENFQRLVGWTAAQGLSGLEFGIGIYGTIGGAVAGNAGAFGSDMAAVVETVDAVDAAGERRTYPVQECGFAYRKSRFIREGTIVVGVSLTTKPAAPAAVKARVAQYLAIKKSRQPLGVRCAGCIFKNYTAQLPRDAQLLERFKDVVRGTEIPAGALIAEVGLSGVNAGGIQVSDLHGNFFVNTGGGTAEQVAILMSRAQQRVRDTFGVQLSPEVHLLGFSV